MDVYVQGVCVCVCINGVYVDAVCRCVCVDGCVQLRVCVVSLGG